MKRERGLSRAGADYELERVMKSSLGILVNAVLAARAEYVELAGRHDYAEAFVESMAFPVAEMAGAVR